MLTALFSFFGGSVFRMIWGEISHWVTTKQDHEQELARMNLQETIDAAQHARNMEAIKVQADLGIKVVQVQADADVARAAMDAFKQAVSDVGKSTGIKFIDIWNGVIRPLLATMAIAMVIASFVQNGFVMTDRMWELAGAILGIYVADRALFHRGK